MAASSIPLVSALDESSQNGTFMIGWGWVGVALCVVPVLAVCIGMIVLSEWQSLVFVPGCVAGMFVIKLIEWAWVTYRARRKKSRSGRRYSYSS
jgi:hypothetical protein